MATLLLFIRISFLLIRVLTDDCHRKKSHPRAIIYTMS